MVDVSGLTAEAQAIVEQAAIVYLRHTAPWFIGLVVHGSAVKGGIIPGCSDVDLQLYLDVSALTWQGHLPLDLAFAIRRELEGISLPPFRYIQCYPRTSEPQEGLVGPIPGAYRLIAGRLPIPEATAQDLRQSARRALDEMEPAPTFLLGSLLGPGGVRLERRLRLLCTKVWPLLYQVLTLQGGEEDPIAIWNLPKEQAIARLPEDSTLREAIDRFYRAVWDYYPAEDSLEHAFELVAGGAAFYEAVGAWWKGAR